jgi:hypothetical protein
MIVVKLFSHDDTLQKLHALVAQLRFHSQPDLRPVKNGQIPSVHAVREKGLGMERIEHTNDVDPVIEGGKADEPSGRQQARRVQRPTQWYYGLGKTGGIV